MMIFRFDSETSVPVTDFGSRLRIGSLVAPEARVQVSVMYLPAEGLVGSHRAVRRQLFAVLTGAGWASGTDGVRRPLRTGYAALWEPGELHEVGSDQGLSAVSIEGEFETWATSVSSHIVVVDYDEEWPAWFDRVRTSVWPAVEGLALRIDHVGSTSVPGLAGKPVIDLDIVVSSEDRVRPAIERLNEIGYRWRGDLGVEGRQAFDPIEPLELPAHHLYLVIENNKAHIDHWLLAETLRSDPVARNRYAALKRANAQDADGDMEVYVARKAAFVAEVLSRARAERGLPAASYWVPDPGPA